MSFRLDADLHVKICDFGMCRDVYERGEYERRPGGNSMMPIKWMAPESLSAGSFPGDVVRPIIPQNPKQMLCLQWSFGVCVWEILTLGKTPYESLVGFDVITYVKSGGRLRQPKGCPKRIYHEVMLPCWNIQPEYIHAWACEVRRWELNGPDGDTCIPIVKPTYDLVSTYIFKNMLPNITCY
jgi:serine/threonine protein kinase